MFSRHYQAELTFLREMGAEFARVNPALASAFAERGGDPDVERLLEGFAFLSARIRERAEDAFPEVVDPLAEMLAPQLLRTLPATTVMQLTPRPGALRGAHRVAAGAVFGSRPVEGTRVLFRSTEEVVLRPLTLEGSQVDERGTVTELAMRFGAPEHALEAALGAGPLRLFLAGPWAVTSTLALWMTRCVAEVVVVGRQGAETRLGPRSLRSHPGDGAAGIVPWPELTPDGPRRLQELFQQPSAHLFFDLHGLERLDPERLGPRFEIRVRFEGTPPLPQRPSPDVVRLHCVPAVNLFDTSAEPLVVDPLENEHRVQAAGLPPRAADVFQIHSVVGLRSGRGGRIDYRPTHAPTLDHRPDPGARYAVRRARSPVDGGLDTYLSLHGAPAPADAEETVSLELTCTHRLLPASLRIGDVCDPLPASPSVASFTNVAPVSKPVSPAVGSELTWRFLRTLALGHRSLAETEALRGVLSEHNLQREVDAPLGRANDRRVEAIRRVSSRMVTRVIAGAGLRGLETVVEVDESGFPGPGDIHLFGCALDELFAAQIPLNTFHVLRLRLHPSLGELTWSPRTGTQSLI